jgi:hypothetical protein
MNKYLKLANYFDSKGLYRSADSLELFVKKAQGLSFAEKQPDLAKIEKSNKIANDIVYYAASISQGTKTPSYDPKSFFTTIQKIESMENNPDVKANFPNIFNSLEAAKELLKNKSLGQTPGQQTPGQQTPGQQTPGINIPPLEVTPPKPGEKVPLTPKPQLPDNIFGPEATKFREDLRFIRKTIEDMNRYVTDIKRWTRKLETLEPDRDSFMGIEPLDKQRAKEIKEIINNYKDLIDRAALTIKSYKYRKVVEYLKSKGDFDPETDIPDTDGGSQSAPGKTESNSGPESNSRSEAGKILDKTYPTYSSRDPKSDQRLPGLSGTGVGRELDKLRINYDYEQQFPFLDSGTNERDPAGGPKLTQEQLDPGLGLLGFGGRGVQLPEEYDSLSKPLFGLFDQK